MFEITELEGLISEPIYSRLIEEISEGVLRFSMYSESANIEVTKLTGYSSDDLESLPILLQEIRVPYAWIIEKLAVRLITLDTDQYLRSVEANYKMAIDKLSKISKPFPQISDNLIGSFQINNIWSDF